jgi:hypothetical protein
MNINYFLLMIKKYDTILNHVNSILEILEDLNDPNILTKESINNKDYQYIIFNSEMNTQYFIERQNHIIYLKHLCKKYIEKICNHDFILDSIDITPDKSKTISYCKFCGINDPNF